MLMLMLMLVLVIVNSNDNDDDDGVGVGGELLMDGVELPTGSAELSVPWLMLCETLGPKLSLAADAVSLSLLSSVFARPLSSGALRQCFVVGIDGDVVD